MAKSKNESINISIFSALKVSEISKVPVLIMSNPGLGKSTTVAMFAKVRGYELQLLRGNSTTAEEVLGYDVARTEADANETKHLIPSWYSRLLKNKEAGKPTLLFLDEITTANEYVQAALLHLIFERMVGDEKIPDDTLIVSAGNYSQNLSNQMNLLPPLMNRFMIFNITPDSSDLDTFLCKFRGAIASPEGCPDNFMENLYKQMKELDSQQLTLSKKVYNKAGEHIERAIMETARFLMNSGEKVLDLKVKELQGIYAQLDSKEDDDKLYGFVTLRTLNYLRDVTLATYICFGKNGITSDNYKNMIDGLCGIGISRDRSKKNSGDLKITLIGNDFYKSMVNIINDIEKMNNDCLPAYEEFFSSVLKGATILDIPKMRAITDKIIEMRSDKRLVGIDRPIDPEVIKQMCQLIKETGESLCKSKSFSSSASGSATKISDTISVEEMNGIINNWNTVSNLIKSINDLVKGSNGSTTGYKQETVDTLNLTLDNLKRVVYRLRSWKKFITSEDKALGEMIVDVNDPFADKKK